jgi:cytochrome c biogenesis protein CcmG/thiol:disulfide interchange protein DsbE
VRPRLRSRAAVPVVVVAALAILSACGASPASTAYTFHPGSSQISEDSPHLQALKKLAGIAACPVLPVRSTVSHGLPDATLPCLGGGHSVDLASLRGPLLLNFWAHTCGPCVQESPMLQSFATEATGKVAVMGVDFYDLVPASAIGFAKELGIHYPQLADPEAHTRAALRIQGLPVTMFVDAGGAVVYRQYGAFESAGQLRSLVAQYLHVSVPSSSGA